MKQTTLPLLRHLLVLFLSIFMFYSTGCYHYRVVAPNSDPLTGYHSKTVHSLFWGLVQSKTVIPENCDQNNSHGIDEVRISTNLGFSLLNVATLGIWCPMTVEWRCSKACPRTDGEF